MSTESKSITLASKTVLNNLLESAQHQLTSELSSISERIIDLNLEDAVAQCTSIEEFKRSKEDNIVVIQLRLAELSTPIAPAASTVAMKSVEMEKSKAPTFSGQTLDYPEFKRGWAKVAAVHWDDGNQVEQIKYKVDAKTKLIISRCSTMAEVWQVMDNEYAQEQEVINAVDIALKKLTSSKVSIAEYIVHLRNYLPTLEEALRGVNGLDHLQSPDRVNLLLRNFDERTLHEWDYFRSKSSGSTYERFFKFLIDRYDAAKSSIARCNAAALTGNTESSKGSSQNVTHTTTKGQKSQDEGSHVLK